MPTNKRLLHLCASTSVVIGIGIGIEACRCRARYRLLSVILPSRRVAYSENRELTAVSFSCSIDIAVLRFKFVSFCLQHVVEGDNL